MKVTGSGSPQYELGVTRGKVGISLQVDTEAIANLQKNLLGVRDKLKRAYVQAVDVTNQQVGAETVRLLSAAVNTEPAEVAARVRVDKVKDGAVTSGSVVILTEPRISLRAFQPQQTGSGVHVQPLRNSSGYTMRSAFGPDIQRLGRGVWRRRGKERLPIKRSRGIALSKLVRRSRVLPKIEVYARVNFKRNLKKYLVAYAFGGAAA